MVRWLGFVMSLLCATEIAQASPADHTRFVTRLDIDALVLADSGLLATRFFEPRSQISAPKGSVELVHIRSGGDTGFGVMRWLVSSFFYSLCLTTGVPMLTEIDQDMVAETLGEPGTLEALVIPDWASGIARALGVMTVSFGSESIPRDLSDERTLRLELTLLPLGPENVAGLSITGSFG